MDGLLDRIGISLYHCELLVLYSDSRLGRLWSILRFLSKPSCDWDECGESECRDGNNRGERCVHGLILSVDVNVYPDRVDAPTGCTASRNCVIIHP